MISCETETTVVKIIRADDDGCDGCCNGSGYNDERNYFFFKYGKGGFVS
jgi:hypothetical protein